VRLREQNPLLRCGEPTVVDVGCPDAADRCLGVARNQLGLRLRHRAPPGQQLRPVIDLLEFRAQPGGC